MIVFDDTLGTYGGSQTLMYRMCKWLYENNIKSSVICDRADNVEIVSKLKALDTKIIVIDRSDEKQLVSVIEDFLLSEEIKVISFIWNYYLDLECIKRKRKYKFENLIYCIHPGTFQKGLSIHFSPVLKYFKGQYGKIFTRMNKNRALIIMDEVDREESEKYLGLKLEDEPLLLRLPMECRWKDDYEKIIREGFSSNIILTAARAQFPYKGYMIGLVKDFVKLKGKYSDLKLVIVSAGEDFEKLQTVLDEVPNEYKQSIKVYAWLEYEKLLDKIEKCKIFIGMGTTVLDAALCYKPSIPVRFDTYENIGNTLIGRRPEYITADGNCNDMAITVIDEVLGLEFEEYREECVRSFRAVQAVYDINVCMKQILDLKTMDNGCILNGLEVARHRLNDRIIRFRNRNKVNFDYNKLKLEKGQ